MTDSAAAVEKVYSEQASRILAVLVRLFGTRTWRWRRMSCRTLFARRWSAGRRTVCRPTRRRGSCRRRSTGPSTPSAGSARSGASRRTGRPPGERLDAVVHRRTGVRRDAHQGPPAPHDLHVHGRRSAAGEPHSADPALAVRIQYPGDLPRAVFAGSDGEEAPAAHARAPGRTPVRVPAAQSFAAHLATNRSIQ